MEPGINGAELWITPGNTSVSWAARLNDYATAVIPAINGIAPNPDASNIGYGFPGAIVSGFATAPGLDIPFDLNLYAYDSANTRKISASPWIIRAIIPSLVFDYVRDFTVSQSAIDSPICNVSLTFNYDVIGFLISEGDTFLAWGNPAVTVQAVSAGVPYATTFALAGPLPYVDRRLRVWAFRAADDFSAVQTFSNVFTADQQVVDFFVSTPEVNEGTSVYGLLMRKLASNNGAYAGDDPLSVNVVQLGGSASSPDNFSLGAQPKIIEQGANFLLFEITTVHQPTNFANLTLTLGLQNPSAGALGVSEASFSILNTDQPVTQDATLLDNVNFAVAGTSGTVRVSRGTPDTGTQSDIRLTFTPDGAYIPDGHFGGQDYIDASIAVGESYVDVAVPTANAAGIGAVIPYTLTGRNGTTALNNVDGVLAITDPDIEIYAGTPPTGPQDPDFRGLELWKDNDAPNNWHLRLLGGSTGTGLVATGQIISTQPIVSMSTTSFEANDIANLNGSIIDFTMNISGQGNGASDQIDFQLADNAGLSIVSSTGSVTTVYLGIGRQGNALSVGVPLEIVAPVATASINTYTAPSDIQATAKSTRFKVSIAPSGGSASDVFVSQDTWYNYGNVWNTEVQPRRKHVAGWDQSGSVDVTIECLTSNMSNTQIRCERFGFSAAVTQLAPNKIKFTIDNANNTFYRRTRGNLDTFHLLVLFDEIRTTYGPGYTAPANNAHYQQVSDLVRDSWSDPLFLFVSPMQTDIPDVNASNVYVVQPGDQSWKQASGNNDNLFTIAPALLSAGVDTIYFAPGIHKGVKYPYFQRVNLPNNFSLYLSGLSRLQSLFGYASTNASNIRVFGRGMSTAFDSVSYLGSAVTASERFEDTDSSFSPIHFKADGSNRTFTNCTIDGIWFDFTMDAAVVSDDKLDMTGVKIFGYANQSDGLTPGTGSLIRKCIFAGYDDNDKTYKSATVQEEITFFQSTNGGIFKWRWKGNYNTTTVRVYGADILETLVVVDCVKAANTPGTNGYPYPWLKHTAALFGFMGLGLTNQTSGSVTIDDMEFQDIWMDGNAVMNFESFRHSTIHGGVENGNSNNNVTKTVSNIRYKNVRVKVPLTQDQYLAQHNTHYQSRIYENFLYVDDNVYLMSDAQRRARNTDNNGGTPLNTTADATGILLHVDATSSVSAGVYLLSGTHDGANGSTTLQDTYKNGMGGNWPNLGGNLYKVTNVNTGLSAVISSGSGNSAVSSVHFDNGDGYLIEAA